MPYLGVSYLEPSFTAVTQKFVKHRRHKKNVSQKKDKKDTSIAEQLGKQKAEQAKNSNDILNHYYGGNK